MDDISRLKNEGLYVEHTDEKSSQVSQEDRIEEILDIATNPSNFEKVFNMNKAKLASRNFCRVRRGTNFVGD